jgi:hypothetical protein
MKFTKFVVLAAGLAGLLAFFLPLVSVKDSGIKGAISAFQIVKGIDSASDVVDQAAVTAGSAADRAMARDANQALGAIKGIVLALFVPAVLLTLLGGLGTARKRFGRGMGAGSLVVGVIGLAIWAILNSAASEAGSDGGSAAGIGLHLLLLTGLGGLVGGLLALVKPDRGELAYRGA